MKSNENCNVSKAEEANGSTCNGITLWITSIGLIRASRASSAHITDAATKSVYRQATYTAAQHKSLCSVRHRLATRQPPPGTRHSTPGTSHQAESKQRLLEVSGISAPALATRHRPLFTRPGLSTVRRSSGGESEECERRLRRPSGHLLKDGIVVYRERTSRESSVSRSSSTQGSREGSPRPRSEDIPLEDIRRNMAAATPVTTQV
ncbi:hypothetical protein RR48_07241 [Papilio machaon]|uniref:Uncharacterized protein n=1 Tax=Papilio machaon TaxID=76193 RepID=A0A194RLU3_PAPMA|nr:hypothetical protein RR48_07241 [Papilio machaon]